MKNKIVSGTIIGIPLNHDLGYIYAKVVNLCDFSELDLSKTFHFVIYPYNYISKDIQSFDINEFDSSNPYVGSLFVMDLEPIVKKGVWFNLGTSVLTSYEMEIPSFRGFSSNVFAVHKYEKDANSWNYFENGRPIKREKASYDDVKHLENSACLSHDLIEKRLSMEVLYRNGKTIEEYYELKDWNDLVVYYNMIYTIPFDEVPDSLKGKVS